MKDEFKGSFKVYATTLIKRLGSDKIWKPKGADYENRHIVPKLQGNRDGGTLYDFLVHFIMSSLPLEFSPFTINYISTMLQK